MRQLFLFLQQAAALTREHCSFFDKNTVACVDCKPFALFLGVIAVTILYLTVVLSFAIDGRLDQFFLYFSSNFELGTEQKLQAAFKVFLGRKCYHTIPEGFHLFVLCRISYGSLRCQYF